MRFELKSSVCALALAVASPTFALAQAPEGKAAASTPSQASSAKAAGSNAGTEVDAKAPAAAQKSGATPDSPKDEAKPAAGTKSVAGYGYRDSPRKSSKGGAASSSDDSAFERGGGSRARTGRIKVPAGGPVATLPGFEMLPDGASRCFVQLSKSVEVEERKSAGSVTYLLKGAHIALRNNQNALETVHFNTPVTRARLIGSPAGLQFVLDLRGAATPSYKLVPAKDGSAILQVEFPAGKYLPTADAQPGTPPKVDGHR